MIDKFIFIIRKIFFKYRFKQLSIGKNVKFDYATKFLVYNNKCIISDNVVLRSSPKGYHAGMPFGTTLFCDVKGAEIIIRENCRLNGVYIHAQKSIEIGKNTVIAAGVNIIDSNGHVLVSENRTKGRDEPKSIKIGDNVWIGLNSIILKNTTIGNNSVVSAGSVVKGSFPNNSIIAGNPAKVVDSIKFDK
jgi:acetyltransferase-like isoleucine patch superfamily enzyme